jgi:aminoglycoside phosphotransferase
MQDILPKAPDLSKDYNRIGDSMVHIQTFIDRFQLSVEDVSDVPDSFSSTVYRLVLKGGETVYLKIPYSKVKLEREMEMLLLLKGHLPVPAVLDHWEGDENHSGALLLEEIQGEPCSNGVGEELAFEIGRYHAILHNAPLP